MPNVKINEETYLKLKELGHCLHSEEGWELLDPDGIAIPAGLRRPLSLREQIQRVLRTEVSAQAQMQGYESFAESEDFDVEDEFDSPEMRSAYEMKEEIPVMKSDLNSSALHPGERQPAESEKGENADSASRKDEKPDGELPSGTTRP